MLLKIRIAHAIIFNRTAKAVLVVKVCVFSFPNSWARNQRLHQIAYTAHAHAIRFSTPEEEEEKKK